MQIWRVYDEYAIQSFISLAGSSVQSHPRLCPGLVSKVVRGWSALRIVRRFTEQQYILIALANFSHS
jgi:hypothetical protein